MPKFINKRWHGLHYIVTVIFLIIMSILLTTMHLYMGIAAFVMTLGLIIYLFIAERAFQREFKNYVGKLTYRVKKSGTDVINELPFGVIIYNDEGMIQWCNPFIQKLFEEEESLIGMPLNKVFPALSHGKDKEKESQIEVMIHSNMYRIDIRTKEKVAYIFDITEMWQLSKKYDDEKLSLGIVMIDNLEEVSQGLDDNQRTTLLSRVTAEITEWAQQYEIYLRRLSSERFMLVSDQKTLRKLEQSRFIILDEVREQTSDQKIPVTLSIGFAAGADDILELGHWAQRSLDIALGRGGDQATVKFGTRQTFYGGKTNAVEKRTRVRARVVAHTLRDLIKESHNVVIMGHRVPDMDCIGAAIGILKAAQMFHKEAYIVLEGVNPSIEKMMELLKEEEKLIKRFITPEQAMSIMTPGTLAVVVDTHKASMVAEPKLLSMTEKIAIVDHHRRGEDFLSHATLIYMEPYASSACELVTELLQYIHDRISLEIKEATALLAGITVDTKSFTLRTGSRTFEAASFLRRNGADSTLIQRMLQEDLSGYLYKAEIIKHAELIHDHIAIAVVEKGRRNSQLLIAQAADTLLNMSNILASFVIGERPDGMIAVSARSLGHMNVQVVMERMGGGGHLTNAAAQLEGTVEEVEAKLKAVLNQIESEEGLFE